MAHTPGRITSDCNCNRFITEGDFVTRKAITTGDGADVTYRWVSFGDEGLTGGALQPIRGVRC